MRKDPRTRQGGEGRHDRTQRPDHTISRRDGACGPRDGASRFQAAAAHRRGNHEPRAHRRQHRAEYEALRKAHSAPRLTVISIEAARARRTPIVWRAEDLPVLSFTGVRVLDKFPLATLRDFIDWTPFFHTWGLKGVYPRILEHEGQGAQARQIFTEANVLLDIIIAKKLITARGVYGLFPANAVGDDVELYTDNAREKVLQRFHFLRQQSNREGSEPCRSLADFIAPKETGLPDHIGAFAVTSGIGLKELCDGF